MKNSFWHFLTLLKKRRWWVTCPAKLHNPKLKAGIFNEKIPDLSPKQ